MSAAQRKKCLILLGMPGAGKSSLGRALAAQLGQRFVDTDDLIESHTGESLQQSLQRLGYLAMRELEGQIVAAARLPSAAVVATGGSVVYSDAAMHNLAAQGQLVYLQISLASVLARVDNWATRGFSAAPGQDIGEVFEQRQPLYQYWAQRTLNGDNCSEHALLSQLHKLYCAL